MKNKHSIHGRYTMSSLLIPFTLLTAATTQAGEYANAVLADGPLAYYPLNEAAADLPPARNSGSLGEDGVGSHVGTARSVEGAIKGSSNGSAYFDGAGAHTLVPFHAALNPPAAESFTIEAWVKPTQDGLATAQAPLFNRRSTNPRQGWIFFQRAADTGFNFRMYNENGSSQSVNITGGTYTVGEWTHLAASWNGSTATLFVNGVAVGSQSDTYVANSGSPLAIGAYGADEAGDNPFTGAIDEVAFYGSALSEAQLKAHFDNANDPARTTGYEDLIASHAPLLYLHLNEPNALNLGAIGARADGTHTVGVTLGEPGALAGSDDTAASYTALVGADGGSPTSIPYAPELNPDGSFTVEAWIKPTIEGLGNAQSPLHNRSSTATNGNGIRGGWDFFQRNSSVGWNWRIFNGDGGARVFDLTGGPYTVGEWQHIVGVYDASGPTATLYQNGAVVATSSAPVGSYAPKTNGDLAIGSFGNPSLNDLGYENAFTGSIDEVAIYPSALSAGQVQAHFSNGINSARAVPYETLIITDKPSGYWRLNEAPHDPAVNLGTLGAVADGVNANTREVAGPGLPGFEAGNRARAFDGITSSIEIGNPSELNFTDQITLEAWVKPASGLNSVSYILGHGPNHNTSAETFLRIANGSYEVGSNDGTPHLAGSPATPDLTSGEWIHLVGTYDGEAWNLYRNGEAISTNADLTGALAVVDANWAIGARGRWKNAFGIVAGAAFPDQSFTGSIDEVAIYDYALSPAQAASHYSAGLSGGSPLTIAQSGALVILTWDIGILQASDTLRDDSFEDVGAVSPALVPASQVRKFYRLRFE
ncbi:LamG domain-containing protein [Verrucomicrobiaceae bacterium 227]